MRSLRQRVAAVSHSACTPFLFLSVCRFATTPLCRQIPCHGSGTAWHSSSILQTGGDGAKPDSSNASVLSADSLDDDDELPPHMIVRAPQPADPQTKEKVEKTRQFVETCVDVQCEQEAKDMLCAAMRLGTLKAHHLTEMLRYAKKAQFRPHERQRHCAVKPRGKSGAAPHPPDAMRRMHCLLITMVEEGYLSSLATEVVEKLFNDMLLLMLDPSVRRIQEERTRLGHPPSDVREGDADDEGDEVEVAYSSTSPVVFTAREIWQFVAFLELHAIPITMETSLDALVDVLKQDSAQQRHSYRSEDEMEGSAVDKNRLEFIDHQRHRLRESKHREAQAGRRARQGPKPHAALSEVSPPEPREW